mgnify:CR=1 FL=1
MKKKTLLTLSNLGQSNNSTFATDSSGSLLQEQTEFTTSYGQPIIIPPHSKVGLDRLFYSRTANATPSTLSKMSVEIPELNLTNFAVRPNGNNQVIRSSVLYTCLMGEESAQHEEEPFEKVYYELNNPAPITLNTLTCRLVDGRGQVFAHSKHAGRTKYFNHETVVQIIIEGCDGKPPCHCP